MLMTRRRLSLLREISCDRLQDVRIGYTDRLGFSVRYPLQLTTDVRIVITHSEG